MDVLVTGSSGVLGQSLVPRLAARGDRLRLFDVVKTPEALGRLTMAEFDNYRRMAAESGIKME